jgi:uncharacterized protein (TIGR03435 family)
MLKLILLLLVMTQVPAATSSHQATTSEYGAARPHAFELASVRLDPREGFQPTSMRMLADRFRATSSLSGLIMHAYDVGPQDRVEGPTLLRSRFVVDARARVGVVVTDDIERQMVRSLLKERFRLKLRVEESQGEGMVLRRVRADRLGPKLVRRATPCVGELFPRETVKAPSEERCNMTTRDGLMRGIVSMADFAAYLSSQVRKRVRDETELDGSYSVDFTFDPFTLLPTTTAGVSPYGTYPSIADVLRDDLGLRLDNERVPVRVLVVEHVEMPSDN